MTMNVHSLFHLERQAINFGPLWTNCMFSFENMVKEVGGLFTGTRGVADQVTKLSQYFPICFVVQLHFIFSLYITPSLC